MFSNLQGLSVRVNLLYIFYFALPQRTHPSWTRQLPSRIRSKKKLFFFARVHMPMPTSGRPEKEKANENREKKNFTLSTEEIRIRPFPSRKSTE